MPVSKDFLPIAGASGQGDTTYAINQSIRFDDDTNNYLSKTPSAASDGGKTYTYSFWIKRNTLAKAEYIIHAGSSYAGLNPGDYIYFDSSDYMRSWHGTNTLVSNRTFKDVSAWYHFVYVYDSTQAISTERVRFYVNGVRETSFSTAAYPSLNATSYFNTNTTHYIGGANSSASRLTSYLAEIHFLDGYAYGPEYFGEFKEDTDIWIPIEYTGSYGTNGFKIDGRDSSDLGDDESGNGNDYASTNFGAEDKVLDSPTNNFCTINPLADLNSTKNTISEGNLKSAGSSSSIWHISPCTQTLPSGKWYFEGRLNTASNNSRFAIGLIPTSPMLTANYGNLPSSVASSSGFSLQLDSNSQGLFWYEYSSGSGKYVTISVDTDNVGTIGHLAIDVDNQKIYAGINGTYYNSSGGGDGNPSTGSNPTYSGTSNFSTGPLVPFIGNYLNSCQGVLNFGQDGTFAGSETAGNNKDSRGIGNFKYSVPSGFLAICTKNLGS